jgi:hypothetical protein
MANEPMAHCSGSRSIHLADASDFIQQAPWTIETGAAAWTGAASTAVMLDDVPHNHFVKVLVLLC